MSEVCLLLLYTDFLPFLLFWQLLTCNHLLAYKSPFRACTSAYLGVSSKQETDFSLFLVMTLLNWQTCVWFRWLPATPEVSFHLRQLMPRADLIFFVFIGVQLRWRRLASCSGRLCAESSGLEIIGSPLAFTLCLSLGFVSPSRMCVTFGHGRSVKCLWEGNVPSAAVLVTAGWLRWAYGGGRGSKFQARRYREVPVVGVVSAHRIAIRPSGFKWAESCRVIGMLQK